MRLELELDASEIFKTAAAAVPGAVARALRVAARAALPGVRAAVKAAAEAHPAYAALGPGGELAGAFGLPPDSAARDGIVAAVLEGVRVGPFGPGPGHLGGLLATAIAADFTDALAAAGAGYVAPRSGLPVPWLEWLLTHGDAVVVGTHFTSDPGKGKFPASRSGQGGIMLPVGGKRPAGFSVPGAYAGTPAKNWLTDAAEAAGPAALGALRDAVLGAAR